MPRPDSYPRFPASFAKGKISCRRNTVTSFSLRNNRLLPPEPPIIDRKTQNMKYFAKKSIKRRGVLMENDIITIEEVAQYLRVSERTGV